jgi:hypothetical protein
MKNDTKTAMQELRDDLIQIFNDNNIPIILQIDKYLEKEKEQIIEAHITGQSSHIYIIESKELEAKEYYNQKYNK